MTEMSDKDTATSKSDKALLNYNKRKRANQ